MFKRNHIDERHSLNKSTTTTAPPPTTLNPIYEYSEEMNAAAEQEFNQRRNKLWEICRKINFIGKYPPNAWEFFLSPGHGIAWCNVFKAASSTMMYYFNILGLQLYLLESFEISKNSIDLTAIHFECTHSFQPVIMYDICNEPKHHHWNWQGNDFRVRHKVNYLKP